MLYSKEKIWINDVEKDIYIYLKQTRNHSYRITAQKISITLPQIYKKPEIIRQHSSELIEKIKVRLAEQPHLAPQKSILENEMITILDEKYKVIRGEKFKFDFHNKQIILSPILAKNKSKLSQALIENYLETIENRIRSINQYTIKKQIQSVHLKNNKSTWGTCSSRGEVTLSISALFAPVWVMDYIIVHELSHLVHHDHSPKFWSLVEKHFPKYKEAKKYLKENGFGLML